MSDTPQTHIDLIKSWGFQHRGGFRLVDSACEIEPTLDLENRDTVYVFTQGTRAMYVGSADEPKSRIGHYRRNHANEKKRRPVYAGLRQALAGEHVDIWTRLIPETVRMVAGLPVGMLLGVEAGLIHMLQPPWNERGKTKPILRSPDSAADALLQEQRELIIRINSAYD